MLKIKNDSPDLFDLMPKLPKGCERQTWHCFASPETFVEFLETKTRKDFWDDCAFTEDNDFYGTSTKKAYAMVREGWQDGADKAQALAQRIAIETPVQKKLTRYGVAGALCDVPRYLANNPLHMRQFADSQTARRPIVTLVNHMGGNASVNAKCFIHRAAVVAGIVDAIEGAGYRCHVIGVNMSAAGSYACGIACTVKEAGNTLDLARVAFALGHVAMFRRLSFNVRTSDPDDKALGYGLGSTIDFDMATRPQSVYVLPSMNELADKLASEDSAATKALPYMLDKLRAQGCPGLVDSAV